MQGRYPQNLVMLIEGVVQPEETMPILAWMQRRLINLRAEHDIPNVVIYESERHDGTRSRPRFLSLFETSEPEAVLQSVRKAYEHQALRPLGCGGFALLDGLPRVTDAQESAGLLVGLTNCIDPARKDEFNDWYDNVHAADVLKSPWYWNAQRYRRLAGDVPEFAAFYESALAEPDAFKNYMKWPERNPEMHSLLANIHVWTFNKVAEA